MSRAISINHGLGSPFEPDFGYSIFDTPSNEQFLDLALSEDLNFRNSFFEVPPKFGVYEHNKKLKKKSG